MNERHLRMTLLISMQFPTTIPIALCRYRLGLKRRSCRRRQCKDVENADCSFFGKSPVVKCWPSLRPCPTCFQIRLSHMMQHKERISWPLTQLLLCICCQVPGSCTHCAREAGEWRGSGGEHPKPGGICTVHKIWLVHGLLDGQMQQPVRTNRERGRSARGVPVE